MGLVSTARLVATAAHDGQTDKAGRPYITHPARVARRAGQRGGWVFEIATAWLHDVVEDTGVTLADLSLVFPTEVVEAVDALTHRPNEPRDLYYLRVARNPIAKQVKYLDIADNADPNRLAMLDDETRVRLELKYARARAALDYAS